MEVGKRVGLQIDGIGLPFYFLVRCKLGDGRVTYVDPFAEGQLLSERDCRERVRRIGRNKMRSISTGSIPVSNRQMLTRLLNNLKKIYMDREDYERASRSVICWYCWCPTPSSSVATVVWCCYSSNTMAGRRHDLITYLKLAPEASDRFENEELYQDDSPDPGDDE